MTGARAFFGTWRGEVIALLLLTPLAALADPADLCESAARRAAQETGVPLRLLRAVALTESGRRVDGTTRPWPWTMNVEGEGRWFPSRAAALASIDDIRARGLTSFDVGCFQINHRWHGDRFASLAEMIDPVTNARYAARLLARHAAEQGDWIAAAGAYHSRTERFAAPYRARIAAHLDRLEDAPPTLAAAPAPLFPGGAPAGLGSLVPLGPGG